mmetsp:Transcript_128128/g.255834  ORF Transcript_128128/g.255834 Transcript_128128/m.255834 type:complete len:386 (+) Transcript_128128:134-1291(+)|eukprot:CAMPEP_0172665812 /NCGR_PEP_ID=MMETSP1074-20121228/7462_1 /TAXON_ID=2916 /ORGANISM="Ceratium fusus, Strain PA161109" /LENGTH=385 /DNA_ID=CAMNT_0013482155 /DNA_START=135 /DNA_END=1292 /DNA_ORIENTATION=+
MPAAPELQARLAYRMLVTETAPPPQPVSDDSGGSCSPLARRCREPSLATATTQHQSPESSQQASSGESCVQMADAYSARCHWRQKSCGDCSKLRLLNSRLMGRLQAAEAHIEALKTNHVQALEDLSARLEAEAQSQRMLNGRLAELEPQVALLEGMTTEQSRRLTTESCGSPRTQSMCKEVETENSDKELGTTNKPGPAAQKSVSPHLPESSQQHLNEPVTPLRSRVPPRSLGGTPRKSKQHRPAQIEEEIVCNSEKEVRDMRDWTRSQQSLEEALFASLKATRDQPIAQRARAATPDWPERGKVFVSQGQASRNSSENRKLHPRSPTSKTRPEPTSPGTPHHTKSVAERDDASQCSMKKDRDATCGFTTPPPVPKILTRRMLSA